MPVQFSRGCPYDCEFCNVTALFGHRPRTKSARQVIAELDGLYHLGWRGPVFFVDDNLIGNKKSLRVELLPALLEWKRNRRGLPFHTQVSINLADDEQLMRMMAQAGFGTVFVGIETPDKDLLVRARKRQNTRGSIVDSVHRLHRHGMVVTAGFIVGFDGETRGAAETMVSCVEAAGIPMAMVGLLTALPNTQLTRRLAREGRLPEGYSIQRPGDADQATRGLNFTPSRPAVEVLADYASILRRLYLPERYFGRVLTLARRLRRQPKQLGSTRGRWTEITALGTVIWRLGFGRGTAWYFWRTVLGILVTRPQNFEAAVQLMALFLHFRRHTRFVLERIAQHSAELDAGAETTGPPRAPAVTPGLAR